MKKLRTRRFYGSIGAVVGFSALFLGVIAVFGEKLSAQYFSLLMGAVFLVLALAAISFLAVCFLPYFRGDRRWFAIPALLTILFFAGTMLLWRLPLPTEVLI